MYGVRNIERFRLNELSRNISAEGSWHKDYDSAYVFVGGLNKEMNEGDIAIVFSEFGEIVDVNLARDKLTGKSRGFAFVAYEDQRSTILAVDNFNGVEICGRTIKVDHVRRYRPPKEYLDLDNKFMEEEYRPSGPDGRGWGDFRQYTAEEKSVLEYNDRVRRRRAEQTA